MERFGAFFISTQTGGTFNGQEKTDYQQMEWLLS